MSSHSQTSRRSKSEGGQPRGGAATRLAAIFSVASSTCDRHRTSDPAASEAVGLDVVERGPRHEGAAVAPVCRARDDHLGLSSLGGGALEARPVDVGVEGSSAAPRDRRCARSGERRWVAGVVGEPHLVLDSETVERAPAFSYPAAVGGREGAHQERHLGPAAPAPTARQESNCLARGARWWATRAPGACCRGRRRAAGRGRRAGRGAARIFMGSPGRVVGDHGAGERRRAVDFGLMLGHASAGAAAFSRQQRRGQAEWGAGRRRSRTFSHERNEIEMRGVTKSYALPPAPSRARRRRPRRRIAASFVGGGGGSVRQRQVATLLGCCAASTDRPAARWWGAARHPRLRRAPDLRLAWSGGGIVFQILPAAATLNAVETMMLPMDSAALSAAAAAWPCPRPPRPVWGSPTRPTSCRRPVRRPAAAGGGGAGARQRAGGAARRRATGNPTRAPRRDARGDRRAGARGPDGGDGSPTSARRCARLATVMLADGRVVQRGSTLARSPSRMLARAGARSAATSGCTRGAPRWSCWRSPSASSAPAPCSTPGRCCGVSPARSIGPATLPARRCARHRSTVRCWPASGRCRAWRRRKHGRW